MSRANVCGCGCGASVTRRYLPGHHRRGSVMPSTQRAQISESLLRTAQAKRAASPQTTQDVIDRIMSRVTINDEGCWVYGNLAVTGYGRITLRAGELDGVTRQNRTRQTHRLMYELQVGPVPDGLHLDHLCRNRACCNPAHLEPVTNRENILRSPLIGAATHCQRGHEFTEESVVRVAGSEHPRRQCKVCKKQTDAESEARRRGTPEYREIRRRIERRRYEKTKREAAPSATESTAGVYVAAPVQGELFGAAS